MTLDAKMTPTTSSQHDRASLEMLAENHARLTRSNRRIVVPCYGGPDVMTVIEEPLPEPGPGEVRVRILVAGVGYPDVLIREGMYPRRTETAVHTWLRVHRDRG
jgi:hypothetical protein